ncbi:pentapeptide repeat-containing protein [Phytohabitans aurantiacus]|uniref:pentapeptide repeat-containing protein n=1 Tax=Phytohabitans aurantiacus TaxID=3016789 RepID=UPI00389B05E2
MFRRPSPCWRDGRCNPKASRPRLLGVDLRRANPSKAYLVGADLEGAHLSRAWLPQARLDGADLTDVNLQGVNLAGASLDGAELTGALLQRAHMEGASLREAKLDGARLDGCTGRPGHCLARWVRAAASRRGSTPLRELIPGTQQSAWWWTPSSRPEQPLPPPGLHPPLTRIYISNPGFRINRVCGGESR